MFVTNVFIPLSAADNSVNNICLRAGTLSRAKLRSFSEIAKKTVVYLVFCELFGWEKLGKIRVRLFSCIRMRIF